MAKDRLGKIYVNTDALDAGMYTPSTSVMESFLRDPTQVAWYRDSPDEPQLDS